MIACKGEQLVIARGSRDSQHTRLTDTGQTRWIYGTHVPPSQLEVEPLQTLHSVSGIPQCAGTVSPDTH